MPGEAGARFGMRQRHPARFRINPEEYYPAPIGHPCHELAGTIVDSRTNDYHEGQRVIVIPPRGSAGLVEYIVSDPGRMILLPDEGSLDDWIMCQPSGTVLYSCSRCPTSWERTWW